MTVTMTPPQAIQATAFPSWDRRKALSGAQENFGTVTEQNIWLGKGGYKLIGSLHTNTVAYLIVISRFHLQVPQGAPNLALNFIAVEK